MLVKIFGVADVLAALFLLLVSFDNFILDVTVKLIMLIHLYKGLISFL
tara:strand:+ start:199 stop:342 length:144 start_codon:yes stop_codon:yes gene_type:complete